MYQYWPVKKYNGREDSTYNSTKKYSPLKLSSNSQNIYKKL